MDFTVALLLSDFFTHARLFLSCFISGVDAFSYVSHKSLFDHESKHEVDKSSIKSVLQSLKINFVFFI